MSEKNLKQETILIVDDDPDITNLLQRMLEKAGYNKVKTAASGTEALDIVEHGNISIVLTDVRMPNMDGIQLLERIKKIDESIIVIIITAFGSIDQAVLCMKMGANDFITKPFSFDIVMLAIDKAIRERRLNQEVNDLRISVSGSADFYNFIGISPPMQEIYDKIKAVAPTEVPGLITGESGTGKELAAQAIHTLSTRQNTPMVSVSCPNIPAQMLESELFGHVKGAFTDAYRDKKGLFEKADHGTIFLDEIGDITSDVQAKLLRVLQESEIIPLGGESVKKLDVRVITSTNKDLLSRIKNGEFREDLYYRINVVHIHMPPLRERRADIHRLAGFFLTEHAVKLGKKISGFTLDAQSYLERMPWHGNVRELKNTILQGVVFAKGDFIGLEELAGEASSQINVTENGRKAGSFRESRDNLLESFEVEFVREALTNSGGNVSKAAREAGLSRQLFQHLMKKYGIKGQDS
jgi:DNA-binding NtrC family response regulator